MRGFDQVGKDEAGGQLAADLKRFDLVVAIAIVASGLFFWWRSRRQR